MSKDIKKYFQYYINAVRFRYRYVDYEPGTWSVWVMMTHERFAQAVLDKSIVEVQIELRKLESMDTDEVVRYAELMTVKNIPSDTPVRVFKNDSGHLQISIGDENAGVSLFPLSTFGGNPEGFHYLLSRGFDLWNLIDSGLALNKDELK